MTWPRVIGNISLDQAIYPNGSTYHFLGGEAPNIACAAASRGTQVGPISVGGDDLRWIATDERLGGGRLEPLLAPTAFVQLEEDAAAIARVDEDLFVSAFAAAAEGLVPELP